MKDSSDVSLISRKLSSSLPRICINEISICNHSYIISMCIYNSEEAHIEIKIEEKENGDHWKSSFDVIAIETMTAKTGSFKSFNVFVNMLENAIKQESSSVSIDLLTSDDLQLMHKKKQIQRKHVSTKRYLILISNNEYDCIYYVLSLRYCGKTDSISLVERIQQLTIENQLLKSQFQSDSEHFDLPQQQSYHVKQENDDYHQQLSFYNSKEKDQQIEFLRQMIRTSEDALIKERIQLQKIKRKRDDGYKISNNQIQLLKTSERQLKSKVKILTNEILLLKKNCSPYNIQQRSASLSRPTSDDQRRYRSVSGTKRLSSSFEAQIRFNPTAYIHKRNLKFRQIESQKKKETRLRLNTSGRHSDSDTSDNNLKSNDNNPRTSKTSSQKRLKNIDQYKSKDSIDSDIERVSSPLILRKAASNNSTILFSPEQPENSISVDSVNDIDQRFKSLQKFFKQNFAH